MSPNPVILVKPLQLIFLLLVSASTVFLQSVDSRQGARDFVKSQELNLDRGSTLEKIALLRKLTPAALVAGDTEKAEKFAKELQAKARETERITKARPRDHEMHISYTILGLAALEKGRVGRSQGVSFGRR